MSNNIYTLVMTYIFHPYKIADIGLIPKFIVAILNLKYVPSLTVSQMGLLGHITYFSTQFDISQT